MVKIEFTTDNADFDDAPASTAAAIIRKIANRIETGDDFSGVIFDGNGNRIGAWRMDEKED